jgi:hypothetical protein
LFFCNYLESITNAGQGVPKSLFEGICGPDGHSEAPRTGLWRPSNGLFGTPGLS